MSVMYELALRVDVRYVCIHVMTVVFCMCGSMLCMYYAYVCTLCAYGMYVCFCMYVMIVRFVGMYICMYVVFLCYVCCVYVCTLWMYVVFL